MKRNYDTVMEDDKNRFIFPRELSKPLFNLGGIFSSSSTPAGSAPTAPPPAPLLTFPERVTAEVKKGEEKKGEEKKYLIVRKKRNKFTKDERDKFWRYWYGNVDHVTCMCCQERTLWRHRSRGWSLGHDIAFSIGGSDHPENVIPICGQCNDEMGNEFTVIGYHIAYQKDNPILYKCEADCNWFIKAFDPEKVKSVRDLREAYHQCGAFDKRCGDFLTKDYYKNFKVTYKGSILKDDDLLPTDTFSDDFLAEIF